MRILRISKVHTFFVGLMMMAILLCCSSQVQAAQDGDYIYTVTDGKAQITEYTGAGGAVIVPNTLGGAPVTSIRDTAFYQNWSITSISLPEGLINIDEGTFFWLANLKSISLPKGLISIGDSAFERCSKLTTISIPKEVTSIGDFVFTGCYNLTNITVADDNLKYSSRDGVLFNKAGTTLVACPGGLTTLSIPQGVTSIGYAAFAKCLNLTTINIPKEVKSISDYGFWDCEFLTSITFNSATTTIYDDGYTIPDSTKIIGYDPSTAKDYATNYNRKFEVIGSTSDVTVMGVKLNKKTTSINVGANETLTATITPTNATNKDVTWDSSDSSIATVDSTGKVVGVKAGTATITVTTQDGSKIATCKVTVKSSPTIKVTKVSLNKKTTSINVGANETLIATISPTTATNQVVTWKSSKTSVATVDSTGKVTGLKAGKAIITVTTVDGKKTATCTVTVKSVP